MHKRLLLFVTLLALLLVSCQAAPAPTATATKAAAVALVATPAATATTAAPPTATAMPPTLTPSPTPAGPPDLLYLQAAIEETLADFDGFSSYVVIDLQNGRRIARNDDVAIAGMSLIKVPILINLYRVLDSAPNIEQTKLITQTTALSSNFAANLLLREIAGEGDAYAGADIVTQSLRDLGIYNTFIAVPIDLDPKPDRLNTYLTPANQRTDITTRADPYRQTTTGDLATLLQMLYACAEENGGALREQYADQLTQAECADILAKMQLNELAKLLETGLPPDTPFSHKVGWIDDTHGDGGIVFSPGGDYVLVMALYMPSWLEWDKSAPLFRRVSQLAYAHFNDADAYSAAVLTRPPAVTPTPIPSPTPDLPRAIVSNTQGVGLTVRDAPGGAEVAVLPDGTVLTLLEAEPVTLNGYLWHKVLTPDGAEGWAADAFFTQWQEDSR